MTLSLYYSFMLFPPNSLQMGTSLILITITYTLVLYFGFGRMNTPLITVVTSTLTGGMFAAATKFLPTTDI